MFSKCLTDVVSEIILIKLNSMSSLLTVFNVWTALKVCISIEGKARLSVSDKKTKRKNRYTNQLIKYEWSVAVFCGLHGVELHRYISTFS